MDPSDELRDIDLTDLDRFADGFPHPVFTRLRGEAPVWFHPATAHTPGGEGFWVVSRHADCVTAGAAKDVFSSETGPGRDGAGGTLIEDLPGGFAAGEQGDCGGWWECGDHVYGGDVGCGGGVCFGDVLLSAHRAIASVDPAWHPN